MNLPFLRFESVDGDPITIDNLIVKPKLRRWRLGGGEHWVAESLYPVAVQVDSEHGTKTYRVHDYTKIITAGLAGLLLLRLLRRLR
ncbi:MAG: hypothetical protein WEB00_13045 [Dehalococcoidia bacterium]